MTDSAAVEAIYSSEDNSPFTGSKWELGAAYTFIRDEMQNDSHMLSMRVSFDLSGVGEFGE